MNNSRLRESLETVRILKQLQTEELITKDHFDTCFAKLKADIAKELDL